MSAKEFRTGTVAIVGRPNVGKSTLLNKFVGMHVAITSRKAQTTRHRIHGILTDAQSQFIFVDTPGFQKQHASGLNRVLNRTVTQVASEVDVIVFVVEAWKPDERDEPVLSLLPDEVPVILALNKVDRIRDKAKFAQVLAEWNARRDFAALVPVSAEKGTQVKALLDEIRRFLPVAPPVYEADEFTDKSERFMAGEFVRERLFRLLGEELPYSTAVVIENFEQEGNLRRIAATIYVDKPNQKAIVIGEGGQSLKRIGTEARHAMEGMFGGKVHLELWVRVKSGWADNEAMLRQFGYE
ncbi:GTPase Era [Usitatibacter palustris]|uniref:GTPase Era n=1 Tax=Usitatibacter palustris TaxID=2732487 RepID=A0A6M4H7E8_9PROT|nr:GTPase Era [Usitatibacter palustris]QJR15302.1 GTPase Era [Usitatibacter palustris]